MLSFAPISALPLSASPAADGIMRAKLLHRVVYQYVDPRIFPKGFHRRRKIVRRTITGHPIEPTVFRLSDGQWRFTWPAGTSPYSIWLDGFLLTDSLLVETFDFSGGLFVDRPPALEILNTADASENEKFPPFVTIQWRGLIAAGAYAVEQFISSVWTEIGQVMEQKTGYYTWRVQDLADDATHLFRVLALDPVGNEGTPINFTIDMTRNPAPPLPTFSISSSGAIVVA